MNTHPPIEHIQSVTLSLYIYFGCFMGLVVVECLKGSWGGWWWGEWLEGSWGGWVCGGVGGGGVHGGVGGWKVHGAVYILTHTLRFTMLKYLIL